MKKLIFILSLLFLSLASARATSDDTCKIAINANYDSKGAIIMKLYNCYAEGKFDSLVPFCNESVDFIYRQKNDSLTKESGTDWRAIDNLNKIFKKLNYARFKIMSAKNKSGEDVLLVRIYLFEDKEKEDFSIDTFFILNYRGEIKIIAIY